MTAFDDAATVLFADPNLGMDATLIPQLGDKTPIRVIVDRNAEYFGDQSPAVEYRTRISVIKSLAIPRQGDHIEVGNDTYRVETVVDGGDDGIVRRFWVKKL